MDGDAGAHPFALSVQHATSPPRRGGAPRRSHGGGTAGGEDRGPAAARATSALRPTVLAHSAHSIAPDLAAPPGVAPQRVVEPPAREALSPALDPVARSILGRLSHSAARRPTGQALTLSPSSAGTSTESLAAFIADFYARSSSASGTALDQLVDDSFVSFVWNALVAEPDVRIGVLSAIPGPAAADPVHDARPDGTSPALDTDNGLPLPALDGDGDGDADVKPSSSAAKGKGKGKGKRAKAERKPAGPTHALRILDDAERALGRDALQDLYGDQLRIVASEETARVAITGSHARVRPSLPSSGEVRAPMHRD